MPDYPALAPEDDIVAALPAEGGRTREFMAAIPETVAGVVHAPYGWTVRQVVGHVVDTERILGYRILRVARGDRAALEGFDENAYAVAAMADSHTLADLAAEFHLLRQSHWSLLNHFHADVWDRSGVVNGRVLTARDLARTMLGHERHHMAILRHRLGAS